MSDAVIISIVASIVGPLVVIIAGALVARGTGKAAEGAQKRAEPPPAAGPPIPELSASDREKVDGLLATVTHMAREIGELQADVAEAKSVTSAAIGYVQRLLDYIGTHLPGRTDVPGPPAALQDHIEP